MQITVSGHHVEVTPPLREYVMSKFERLQRHFDQITNTDVTLIVEKLIQSLFGGCSPNSCTDFLIKYNLFPFRTPTGIFSLLQKLTKSTSFVTIVYPCFFANDAIS